MFDYSELENDPLLKALGELTPESESIQALLPSVREEEKRFQEAVKRQTLSSADRLRCYNL